MSGGYHDSPSAHPAPSRRRPLRAAEGLCAAAPLPPLPGGGLDVALLVDLPFADQEHAVKLLPLAGRRLHRDSEAVRGPGTLAGRLADAEAGVGVRVTLRA